MDVAVFQYNFIFKNGKQAKNGPRRHSLQSSTIEGKALDGQGLAAIGYFSQNMNYNGVD